MGASFSSVFMDPAATCSLFAAFTLQSHQQPQPQMPTLGDLPESCVAPILENLDPVEICKLATLNRAFRGASWADFVWESKLPENYRTLMEKVLGIDVDGDDRGKKMSKREIYTRLCAANSFDGGTKKVWLDKTTGGACLSIASKGLSITGIDDRRYWNHIPSDESRILLCCISPADMVVRGQWRVRVPVPSRDIQSVLQATARPNCQEIRPQDLQHRARPRMGSKASPVRAVDIWWSVRIFPVLFERYWEVESLPCWRLCGRERRQEQHSDEAPVFDDTDRLYTYQGRSVSGHCTSLPM
ncbi:F-box protein PP2-A12 [Linum perenne]